MFSEKLRRQNLIFIYDDRPVSTEAQTDLDRHLDQRPHRPMCMRENKCTCRSTYHLGSSKRFRVQSSLASLPCVLEQGTIIFALIVLRLVVTETLLTDVKQIFYPVPSLFTSYDWVVSLASCKRYPIFVPGFLYVMSRGFLGSSDITTRVRHNKLQVQHTRL